MWKKLCVLALVITASGFAAAPRVNAGTEMIEPENAPAPRYNYAPPVYYPRPVVGIAVYPAFGYYPRPFGFYGHRHYYHRGYYGRHAYRRGHYWR